MQWRRQLGLLFVLGACGDNYSPPWQSGSRMRTRLLVANDGFKMLTGWHDSEAGVDCSRSDGPEDRCAADVLDRRYADSSCTVIAAEVPTFARYAWLDADVSVTAFELDETMPVSVPYTIDPVYGCIEAILAVDAVAFVARPVDASILAVSTATRLATDFENNRYTIERHEWTDGAFELRVSGQPQDLVTADASTRLRTRDLTADEYRIPVGVYDSELGQPCTPTIVADRSLRCVPDAHETPKMFADAACSISAPDVALATGQFYVRDEKGWIEGFIRTTEDLVTDVPVYSYWGGHGCQQAPGPVFQAVSHVRLTGLVPLTTRTE